MPEQHVDKMTSAAGILAEVNPFITERRELRREIRSIERLRDECEDHARSELLYAQRRELSDREDFLDDAIADHQVQALFFMLGALVESVQALGGQRA